MVVVVVAAFNAVAAAALSIVSVVRDDVVPAANIVDGVCVALVLPFG